jgi:hypothetical protein
MSALELAVVVDSYLEMKRQLEGQLAGVPPWRTALGEDDPLLPLIDGLTPRSIYFGSEFCEFLLPAAEVLKRALRLAGEAQCALSLLTPMASDGVIARLRELLPLLPAGSELIVNDWGVAAFAQREFPGLRLAAGRLLCKMIKDPRLDNAVWADLYPHGLGGRSFHALLDKLGIARIELDVPPYAKPQVFSSLGREAAVHAPYAYVAKGRICKLGSLSLAPTQKFAPGRECQRECLRYTAAMERPGKSADLGTQQRGNTMFYRHTPAMSAAAATAIAQGWLQRVVLRGH